MKEQLISATEGAKLVSVSVPTIIYWIEKSKILPAFKVGKTWAVKVSDLTEADAQSKQNVARRRLLCK